MDSGTDRRRYLLCPFGILHHKEHLMKSCFGSLSIILIPLFLLVLIILMLLGALFYGLPSSSGGRNTQIVQNALARAEHLPSGGAKGYAVVRDSSFRDGALRFWYTVCASVCT